jgi:hypothetical protein
LGDKVGSQPSFRPEPVQRVRLRARQPMRPDYVSNLFDGFYGWHLAMQQGECFTVVGTNANFDSVAMFVGNNSSYLKSGDLANNNSMFNDDFKA